MRRIQRQEARRAGQRGGASLEALIMLPFFFLVWGCVFFIHQLFEQQILVNENARTCAWDRMSGGCSAPTSPACNFSSGPEIPDSELEGGVGPGQVDNIDGHLRDFVIDFRGTFGPAFRPVFGAQKQTQVTRPRQMGGGERTVRAGFSEMCNDRPNGADLPAISAHAYCQLTGWCP